MKQGQQVFMAKGKGAKNTKARHRIRGEDFGFETWLRIDDRRFQSPSTSSQTCSSTDRNIYIECVGKLPGAS